MRLRTVTVTIADNLDFWRRASPTMFALGRSQQALLEHTVALACGALALQTRYAHVKRTTVPGIYVRSIVRLGPVGEFGQPCPLHHSRS